MGTLVNHFQMGDVENGLKSLRRSRLMAIQEFKDMYNAIDKHHRDLKLAHLTGKAKDILIQVQRDARFFHILIKMMCEVKDLKTLQQKQSLQQVYTWFKLNRHTLYSGPHFGKVHHMKEAQDILKSCTTPRSDNSSPRRTSKSTKTVLTDTNRSKDNREATGKNKNNSATVRLTSAGSSAKRFFTSESTTSKITETDQFTPRDPFTMEVPSSKDYVNEYLFNNFMSEKPVSGRPEFTAEDFISPYYVDGPEPELLRLESSFGEGETKVSGGPSPPRTTPRDDGSSVSARYIDSLVNESRADLNEDDDDLDIDLTTKADCDDNEFSEMRRKLSRPQTESPSLRGAISNQASSISIAMPKKMIHPIASLVNPHAQLAAMEAQKAEEEYLSAREKTTSSLRGSVTHPGSQMSHYRPVTRPSTVTGSRADNLHAWKSFSKDMSYGQDILMLSPAEVNKENIWIHQPLEEFYQLTDGYYPHKVPKYKTGPKPKSAPPKRSSEPQEKHKKLDNKPPQQKPLGKNLLSVKQVTGSQAEDRIMEVKLDAVFGMIDAVSDEMNAFKEKLAPNPQPGFRQPSSTGVSMRPLSRPTTASGHRSPSPIQRANTPTRGSPEPEYFPHPDALLSRPPHLSNALSGTATRATDMGVSLKPQISNRPLSAQQMSQISTRPLSAKEMSQSNHQLLSEREILMSTSELPEDGHMTPLPGDSANNAIDWRGRVTPDSSRYKWQKTRFGGHTYVKKLQTSKRPVGGNYIGKRPQTAPLPTRERWNTENPSDLNARAPGQAATHNTKLVDQKAVDNMMVVQHLMGSSDSKNGSMQSLFLDEDFLKSFSARHTPVGGSTVTATPASMEYLSFVSNAPKSSVDSRTQSRLTSRRSDRTESRVEELPQDEVTEENLSHQPTPVFDAVPSLQTVNDQVSCHIPATEQHAPPSSDLDKTTATSHPLNAESEIAETTDEETGNTLQTDSQDKKLEDDDNTEQTSEELLESDNLINRTSHIIDVIQEEDSEAENTREQTPINTDQSQLEETINSDQLQQDSTVNPIREHLTHPVHYSEDLENGDVHIEVTAIPSTGRAPTPPTEREGDGQELSKSELWNFTPDVENQPIDRDQYLKDIKKNPHLYHRGEHWMKAIVKPENYCFDCIPDNMSTKVGRSAGRMPGRSQSASSQVLRMAKKQNEYFSRAPPIRTPPSIPSPYHQSFGRSPRYGETYNSELERHARTMKSPRHFMEHVGDLRKEIRSAPSGSGTDGNDLLMGSLHVCKLDVPTRSNTETDFSLSNRDQMQNSFLREDTLFSERIEEEGEEKNRPLSGKRVEFESDSDNILRNNDSALANSDRQMTNGDNVTDGDDVITNATGDTGFQSPGQNLENRVPGTTSQVTRQASIAHIGRPIAQVSTIPDPDEEAAAIQLQKEAKAAVDIQRIFRGYVARTNYRKLITSERYKLEDGRKDALEHQRQHKAHVERTQAIYNRPPVSQEQKEWANTYREIKGENAKLRDRKMEELVEQNHTNHQQASSKLSVIGPHVEIYQVYHPKQTGPTRKELEVAAVQIQKHMRGFVVRKKFEKLKRKAQWHGSSFKKMVRDYKGTLSRCQTRHGVDKPSTPFTFKDMNEYMDARRRYESVFDRKAFGGELELTDLDQFFRECDLYPSATEIEEALDVVLHGSSSMKRGLQKKEVLECVFYIYVPRITGLTNTRHSTWMNPIIDGVEARKFLGSNIVEPAPLDVCAKLVIDSKRERRVKENKETERLRKEEKAAKIGQQRDSDDDDDDD